MHAYTFARGSTILSCRDIQYIVRRETLDGFQGGLQIGGRTNLRYADGIILLATSEAELQELVDRLDRVSRIFYTAYTSTLKRPR